MGEPTSKTAAANAVKNSQPTNAEPPVLTREAAAEAVGLPPGDVLSFALRNGRVVVVSGGGHKYSAEVAQ